MDKIEHFALERIPPQSLNLRLARNPIGMQHDSQWRVDKLNPVDDLLICISGGGRYIINDKDVHLTEGEALLIPRYTRFRGRHDGSNGDFIGVAQHFTLELFETGDLIEKMSLKKKVGLKNWEKLRPFVELYRENSRTIATTLPQHHQFMVLLLAFLETAFMGWRDEPDAPKPQDNLSLQIMMVATNLSADPLGGGLEDALADIPYNQDYFKRAFRNRLGFTPQKFRELKRMEFAIHRLASGLTVKQVALELGYSDPYFFSRQFKRHIGASPSRYRAKYRRPVA